MHSSFGANDWASERRAAAGCRVRGEAANGLVARAWCHCRACDAREVCARMLGMRSAYAEIPRLPVLPQVASGKDEVQRAQSSPSSRGRQPGLPSPQALRVGSLREARRGSEGRGASRLVRPPARLWRHEGRDRPRRRAGWPPTRPAGAALWHTCLVRSCAGLGAIGSDVGQPR